MKTSDAKEAFLDAKAGLSPRSLEQYCHSLALLERCCPQLPDGPQPLRRALSDVHSVWVRDGHWRVWGAFYHWCHLEYGTPNPMERVERPRRPDVEMHVLEPQELAQVMAAPDMLRDRAVLALALDAGVRGSEFGGLRIVDVGSDTIRLWGKGNRQARVPISPETAHLLRLLAEQNGKGGFLFTGRSGKPLTRSGIYFVVSRAMRKAGIPGPKLGPHCLRHSLGTNFIASGGNPFTLRRVMRHANIATTQKYVHLAMRDVIDEHHRHTPLRSALQGAQGVLWKQEVVREAEEILEGPPSATR